MGDIADLNNGKTTVKDLDFLTNSRICFQYSSNCNSLIKVLQSSCKFTSSTPFFTGSFCNNSHATFHIKLPINTLNMKL
jgi:hypothetical protein